MNVLRETPGGSVDSKAGPAVYTSDSAVKATVLHIRPGKSIRISVVVPPFTKKGDTQLTPLSVTSQRGYSMSQTNHSPPISSNTSSPTTTTVIPIPIVNEFESRSSQTPPNSSIQHPAFPQPSSPVLQPQSLRLASPHSSCRSLVSPGIPRTSSSQLSPDSGPPQPSPGDSQNPDAFNIVELSQIPLSTDSHENTNPQELLEQTSPEGDLTSSKSTSSKPEEMPLTGGVSVTTPPIIEAVRPDPPSPTYQETSLRPRQSTVASTTGTPGGQATSSNPNKPASTSTPSSKTTHKVTGNKKSEAEEGCSKCCIIS